MKAGLAEYKREGGPLGCDMANAAGDIHKKRVVLCKMTIDGVTSTAYDFLVYESLGSDIEMLLGSYFGEQYDIVSYTRDGSPLHNGDKFFYFKTDKYNKRGLKGALCDRQAEYFDSEEYREKKAQESKEERRNARRRRQHEAYNYGCSPIPPLQPRQPKVAT